MVKIVISLGGSIFSKDEGVDVDYIREFSEAFLSLKNEHEFYIVTGGGRTARNYIDAGRGLGANEDFLDTMGIVATRLNAMILKAAFGGTELERVPERVEEAENKDTGEIYVMGGTVPGHSTDAVSAMLAEQIGADLLINATNVDGVYERDPKKDPKAKKYTHLTPKELLKIVKTDSYQAGMSSVIDPKAAEIIQKNRLKTAIVDGRKVDNIISAIQGEVRGTLLRHRL